MSDQVEFRLQDYRLLEPSFDRVVSVGVFEVAETSSASVAPSSCPITRLHLAKNKHTFAKRQREIEKKRKAEQKRLKKQKIPQPKDLDTFSG